MVGIFGRGRLAESLSHGVSGLGHAVADVSTEAIMPVTRLGRLIAQMRPELLRFSPNWRCQLNLLELVVSTTPDLVLVVKAPYLQAEVIDRMRRRTKARILNWLPDDPLLGLRPAVPLSALRRYDRVIVYSPAMATRVRDQLGLDVQCIPFGFDPRYYFPAAGPRSAASDVAFVGQYRLERGALLMRLLEAGFSMRIGGP
ncbi:MAG TPA: hypothetical protein VE258_11390, partial [Ktedonobacterales bacterium]|nr:hypothetical protein [Ktedonobacterales bacterium]